VLFFLPDGELAMLGEMMARIKVQKTENTKIWNNTLLAIISSRKQSENCFYFLTANWKRLTFS